MFETFICRLNIAGGDTTAVTASTTTATPTPTPTSTTEKKDTGGIETAAKTGTKRPAPAGGETKKAKKIK
ncbi:hypothetical protein SARC_17477, partial [Sphaeroforma arctica JP610]